MIVNVYGLLFSFEFCVDIDDPLVDKAIDAILLFSFEFCGISRSKVQEMGVKSNLAIFF